MKKIYLLFLLCLCAVSAMAQAPVRFTYQAIVRNNDGVLYTTDYDVRLSIWRTAPSAPAGQKIYQETHSINGASEISLTVGTGSVESGSLDNIEWGNGIYYLVSEYLDMDSAVFATDAVQLLSVPYALFANQVGGVVPNYYAVTPTANGYSVTVTYSNGQTQTLNLQNGAVGPQGATGPTGPTGPQGASGVSPTVTVNTVSSQDSVLIIVDSAGVQTTHVIRHGQPGPAGPAGQPYPFSPTVTVSTLGNNIIIIIPNSTPVSLSHGTDGPVGPQGPQGARGAAGMTPVFSFQPSGNDTIVTITDALGSHSFTIHAGAQGSQGSPGAPGAPGFSPTVNTQTIGDDVRVTVTTPTGQQTYTISNGKSAYRAWLDAGHSGSEADFLSTMMFQTLSLSGRNLSIHPGNSVVMLPDSMGTTQLGASAYQAWLASGHTGTEADYLQSLRGGDGTSGIAPVVTLTVLDSLRTRVTITSAAHPQGESFVVRNGIDGSSFVQSQSNWNETETNSPSYIRNKPNLSAVATSGNYNDLQDRPDLFNGDYNSLTNRPTIPTVPTNVGVFQNDASYVSNNGCDTLSYCNLAGLLNALSDTLTAIESRIDTTIVPPTVHTNAVQIAGLTAHTGGEVLSDGGAPVTGTGVCWDTVPHPDLSHNHTIDVSWQGLFSSTLRYLSPATLYYVRAYATNAAGTGYGEELTFTAECPAITVSIAGADSSCSFEGITLEASGAVSYVWSTGATSPSLVVSPITTTTYTVTGTDALGCTATASKTVTVFPKYHGEWHEYACDSFEWAGQTYMASGDYTRTFQTINGCDSVWTLHLTILSSVTTQISATALESYTWNGQTYTQSGDYTQTFPAANGCDSVVTLHLTVNHRPAGDAQPCPGTPTVTDYDGNVYNTVKIGNQCWMKENLRTTHFADGSEVIAGTTASSTEPYRYDNSGSNITLEKRGYLYNWPAVMHGAGSSTANPSGVQGICPTGWHVPSDAEWTQLTDYVGSVPAYQCGSNSTYVAKALADSTGWNSYTGTCAVGNNLNQNNATGYGASPAGYYNGIYGSGNSAAYFWSATEPFIGSAFYRYLNSTYTNMESGTRYKSDGYSVRCVLGDGANLPAVTTSAASNITATTATCGGNVTYDGNTTVTARGVCWNTTGSPTVSDAHTNDGSGAGAFTSSLTGLQANTTYHVRAYATNSVGTAYGNEVTFTTGCPSFTVNILGDDGVCINYGTMLTASGAMSYVWSTGATTQNIAVAPTQTTTYTVTGTDASGCTATATKTVIVFSTDYTNLHESACDSYEWNGETYTQSGDYTQTFQNVHGCDSVVTLHLTIVPAVLASVTTGNIGNVTTTSATAGGSVTVPNDDCSTVTARGVCWNTTGTPTINDSHTNDGSGVGTFTSSLTGLQPNTTYHVRAYATNSAGTAYGNEVTFTTGCPSFTVSISGDDGVCLNDGTMLSASGATSYVWSTGATTQNIAVTPSQTTTYTVTGTDANGCTATASKTVIAFSTDYTDLHESACYYYEWNGQTYTASGDYTQTFQNVHGCDSVVTLHLTILPATLFSYSGNMEVLANTPVTLMATGANVVTWTDVDGAVIGTGNTVTVTPDDTTIYTLTAHNEDVNLVVNGDFEQGNTGFTSDYSYSNTMQCRRYTIQSDAYNYLSDTHVSGIDGNNFMIVDGYNSSTTVVWSQTVNVQPGMLYAFSAKAISLNINYPYAQLQFLVNGTPIGYLDVNLPKQWLAFSGTWSSEDATTATLTIIDLTNSCANNDFGLDGIRFAKMTSCETSAMVIVETIHVPTVTTANVTNIGATTATSGGNVTTDGGATVTARGVCWNTTGTPTVNDAHTTDGSGTGTFTSSLVNLQESTTYHVRAYATNSAGTAYGEERVFTTESGISAGDAQPCPNNPTVTDYDGNVYNTVQIGQQCWMKENLRTTHYADGVEIPAGTTSSTTEPYRYAPNNNSSNVATYGYFYNWPAAMHGVHSSSSNPSNVQGACPTGWHIPSDAEWVQLTDYVSSVSAYHCNSNSNSIAKALAATTGWNSYGIGCTVGNDLTANNATGFSAVAPGYYEGNYNHFGVGATWWSSTEDNSATARQLHIVNYSAEATHAAFGKDLGYSVRCVLGAGVNPPAVITGTAKQTGNTSAYCSGEVISDCGTPVTERGICWSAYPNDNPTVGGAHASAGSGTGSFTANLTGLDLLDTLYYVRAYATNSAGTAYGEVIPLYLYPVVPKTGTENYDMYYNTVTVFDHAGPAADYDDNCDGMLVITAPTAGMVLQISGDYNTESCCDHLYIYDGNGTGVQLADLCGTGSVGTPIFTTQNTVTLRFVSDPSVTDPGFALTVTAVQPVVPGSVVISGYDVVCDGGTTTLTATSDVGGTYTWSNGTTGSHITVGAGTYTVTVTSATGNSLSSYPFVVYGAQSANVAVNQTACNSYTWNGTTYTQSGDYTRHFTTVMGCDSTVTLHLTINSDYHEDVYMSSYASYTWNGQTYTQSGNYIQTFTAANGCDSVVTLHLTVHNIPAGDAQPCPNTPTVTDYDGNTYNTVKIGNQCWMKENLRTTHYADGVSIPLGSTTSTTAPYYYECTGLNTSLYGYLYNWPAVMHGAGSSNANPSNVQGVCPAGWHVPSNAEWTQLVNYVSGEPTYQCGGNSSNIAKALAATEGWYVYSGSCIVGDTPADNNVTGFSALPAGGYFGSYSSSGDFALFWSATETSGSNAWYHYLSSESALENSANSSKFRGYSVRCVLGSGVSLPVVTTSNVSNVGSTTATGGGNVTSDGNATVTARGVCWNTTGAPTVNDAHTTNGSGTGTFTSSLSSLQQNTTYHVRAYATNSMGTAYGEEVVFTTGCSAFTVSISGASSVCLGEGVTLVASGAASYVWSTGETNQNLVVVPTQTTTYTVTGTNASGCAASASKTVTVVTAVLATVHTTNASNVTPNSATTGGSVTVSNNCSDVTERGVCWNTTGTPTINDSHTSDGSGVGTFTSTLSSLQENTTYHVRAYATNSAGTAYGEEIAFTTGTGIPAGDAQPCPNTPTVTDYDGNVYNTVKIGNQCWMKENLRVTHYADGVEIPAGSTPSYTDAYRYAPNNNANNVTAYGYLYNWTAVMHGANSNNDNPGLVQGVCPTGWHLPSSAEWDQLTNYVSSIPAYQCGGNTSYIVKALASNQGWNTGYSNTCSVGNDLSTNNATGFSAMPACYYNWDGYGMYFGRDASFWSSTAYSNTQSRSLRIYTPYRNLYHDIYLDNRHGLSVRCILGDGANLPAVTTAAVTNITLSTATSGGNVTYDGNTTVTERGVCWNTTGAPTLNDSHTSDGSGTGSFTSTLASLAQGTTYYVRAYATNSMGTAYGNEVTFTTLAVPAGDAQPCPNNPTVTDYDGNVYNTVKIGNQCWMKENLRTTHYADGTAITLKGNVPASSSNLSSTAEYYYIPNGNTSIVATYGYVYNWPAVMHGATSSSANPSGVQGICPTGWHLPSSAEWDQLANYVSSVSIYRCNGSSNYIAKALCSNEGWSGSSSVCRVGNDMSANNLTGFNAMPAGGNGGFGQGFYVWSATASSTTYAYGRDIYYNGTGVTTVTRDYNDTRTVRCILGDGQSLPTVITTPVHDVTLTTAICGGEVTSDGGAVVAAHGICWNTTGSPTINDVSTFDGNGTGTFTSTLVGLVQGTTYYVRAYATNSMGTAYGNEVTFTTLAVPAGDAQPCPNNPTVTDYDGNVYNTVKIGNQCWMKENLRTTHFADGVEIPLGSLYQLHGICRYYPNGDELNVNAYGYLYSWEAVMYNAPSSEANPSGIQGICPTGWHVPSDAEWTQLTDYMNSVPAYRCGNNGNIAKAISATEGWDISGTSFTPGNNMSTNNASGFNAMPAGYFRAAYNYIYEGFGTTAEFWSSTKFGIHAAYRSISYNAPNVGRSAIWDFTRTMRCLLGDGANLPNVATDTISNVGITSVTCGGNVTTDGGSNVTARGVCWNTAPTPTLDNAHTTNGTGTGMFTSEITGLQHNTTYYIRAYATNAIGTVYGDEVSVTTLSFPVGACPESVTDYDGNLYNTVQIGQQCWMKENVRTTHYADGTDILLSDSTTSYDVAYRYNPDNNPSNVVMYGYLYNWAAVMRGMSSCGTNPSNVQGVCPTGWHMPSEAEWAQLTDYVRSVSAYRCNGYVNYIAKALAASIGWNSSDNTCAVGNGLSQNNITDFSALPAGLYDYNSSHLGFSNGANLWSATQYYNGSFAQSWNLVYDNNSASINHTHRFNGLSVRCLLGAGTPLPTVTTDTIAQIGATSATSGGNVTADGGSTVTARGVCWNTTGTPTLSDSHTIDGSGTGTFTSAITGLQPNTTYYVCAYATNSVGTAYGNEVIFTTIAVPAGDAQPCPNNPTVTDYDGNVYNTVKIGNQCWMKENLRTTHYADGTLIPVAGTGGLEYYDPYRYAPNGDNNIVSSYGYLYNWPAVMHNMASSNTNPSGVQGVCPTGWHMPSDAEWTQLTDYVSSVPAYQCGGNSNSIAKALSANTGWNTSGSSCAIGNDLGTNNATGFSALPTGFRDGYARFADYQNNTFFWCTSATSSIRAAFRHLLYNVDTVFVGTSNYKSDGMSVRCVLGDGQTLPNVTTAAVMDITLTTATSGGNVVSDGGATVTARGVCWNTTGAPTLNDSHTSDGSGVGTFTSTLSSLQAGTTYYVRAYATNSMGTAYGNEVTFTTLAIPAGDAQPCPNNPTVTDYDGNVYNTVQIGNQCWMKENLRTTHYADGIAIPAGSTGSYEVAYRYNPNNDANNVATYGYLYNYMALMHGAASSAANPSGVQGICPAGWHVPSDAEWTQLTDYVRSVPAYVCGGYNSTIAKALASTTGWNSDSNNCTVGNEQSANNATGFNALPAGYYSSSIYRASGSQVDFWSSTELYSGIGWNRYLTYNNPGVYRSANLDGTIGCSVRCLLGSGANPPTVTTGTAKQTGNTSAYCGGNVTADNGATVTERGVCWSTSHNPTVGGDHAAAGSGTGTFTADLTGLTPGETYHIRAYATNGMGTTYGEDVTLTLYTVVPKSGTETYSLNNGETVTVYDHAGPNADYDNYCDGSLVITAPAGMMLSVTGNYNTENCCDHLYIYDGTGTNVQIADFRNSGTISTPVTTTQNSVTLRFTSDVSVVRYGFELTVTALPCVINTLLDTTLCSNDLPLVWNGQIITASGTYTANSQTANGCDSIVTLTVDVVSAPVLAHTPDTTVQANASVTLWASGANNFVWTDTNGDTLAIGNTVTVNPATTTTYYVTGGGYNPNLVTNGDFEQGNTGFTTAYSYVNDGYYGHYYIGHENHEMWSWDTGDTMYDHTTGSGLWMMVDAYNGRNIWTQTVNVSPNTTYLFSAWFLTDNIANVRFEVNDQQGDIFTTPEQRGVWERRQFIWNSGSNTTATLKINTGSATSGGHDFGIDDIEFREFACATTESITVNVGMDTLRLETDSNACYYGDSNDNVVALAWLNGIVPMTGTFDWYVNGVHDDNLNGYHNFFSGKLLPAATPYQIHVVYTYDNGTTLISDPVEVRVWEEPQISLSGSENQLCGGGNVTLGAYFQNFDPAANYVFQWYRNAVRQDSLILGWTADSLLANVTETTNFIVYGYIPIYNVQGLEWCGSYDTFRVEVVDCLPAGDAQPCPNNPTVTDYDGNVYNTVKIGNQCWMKENLRTTHYEDGVAIPAGGSTSLDVAYRYNPDNDANNVATYGYLYNWPAMMHGAASSSSNPSGVQGICPTGWHVPSDAEWTQLANYVNSVPAYRCNGGSGNIAKALASTTGWMNYNDNCVVGNEQNTNNATGFGAMPAGRYIGGIANFSSFAGFWSSTQYNSSEAMRYCLHNYYGGVNQYHLEKSDGYSVRCVLGAGVNPPAVTTSAVSNIGANSATSGGNVTSDGGATVTARGICWNTTGTPTLSDSHTTDGTGTGTFTSTLAGLQPNTTYYVRAYATNSMGTAYGNEVTFTTTCATYFLHDDFNDGVIDPAKWTYTGNAVLEEEGLLKLQQNVTDQDVHIRSVDMTVPSNGKVNMDRRFWLHKPAITTGTYIPGRYYTPGNFFLLNGDVNSWVGVCYSYTEYYDDAYHHDNPRFGIYLQSKLDGVETWIRLCDVSFDTWMTEHIEVDFTAGTLSYYMDTLMATVTVPGLAGRNVTYYNANFHPYGWWTGHQHYMDWVDIYGETGSVTTSPVSNVTTTTASCGGSVTSDGCTTITVRGVCWSTSHFPTLNDSHTTDGSGTGSFTSALTGLQAGTTYYVRAYATNSLGTLYGNEVSFTIEDPCERFAVRILGDAAVCAGSSTTLHAMVPGAVPPVAVGDILCTDNTTVKPADFAASGKTAMGVVFHVDGTGLHGWAVHLNDQGTSITWGGYGTDIPDMPNYGSARTAIADTAGYSNTQIIRAAGDASTYPAAWAVDLDNGWYLPAAGQLRTLYGVIPTLNATLSTVGGTQFPMNGYWYYWSSTERGESSAWSVSYYGYVSTYGKSTYARVRSVCAF